MLYLAHEKGGNRLFTYQAQRVSFVADFADIQTSSAELCDDLVHRVLVRRNTVEQLWPTVQHLESLQKLPHHFLWLRASATIPASLIFDSGRATFNLGDLMSRCASFMCVSSGTWTCSECGHPYCFFHATTHGHESHVSPEQELAVSA